jgi:hypothetical protein
MEETEQFLTS